MAYDVKYKAGGAIDTDERLRIRERLAEMNRYKSRVTDRKPLDAINHRINTLEFYMFGYETGLGDEKRFIFSPLGNLFIKHIEDEEKLQKIFATMLYAIQFPHYANNTPHTIQLYPFRLIFKLLREKRLNNRLFFTDYIFCIADIQRLTTASYEGIVKKILKLRKLSHHQIQKEALKDEHYYVKCVYEWQYYTTRVLEQANIVKRTEGEEICKLYHPQKPNSKSQPTKRILRDGYIELSDDLYQYVEKLLNSYSYAEQPVLFNSPDMLIRDSVKDIYNFYPSLLLQEIGDMDPVLEQLLQLPTLIEEYSKNEGDEKAPDKFEMVLKEGFEMFVDVEVERISGSGNTDLACLYTRKMKKFAVEAKSTKNKLAMVSAGRLHAHRKLIGAEYTIIITPAYVPAIKRDITGENTVILLASTFSEYLYNHIFHNVRNISYADFDEIVTAHLGEDISVYIANKTLEKFSVEA